MNLNLPSPSAVAVLLNPVEAFFAVTVAPDTTAPRSSATVPEIDPVTDWPQTAGVEITTISKAKNKLEYLLILPSSVDCLK
jgi:hypothetical protein